MCGDSVNAIIVMTVDTPTFWYHSTVKSRYWPWWNSPLDDVNCACRNSISNAVLQNCRKNCFVARDRIWPVLDLRSNRGCQQT